MSNKKKHVDSRSNLAGREGFRQDAILAKLKGANLWHDGEPLRLHLGCGEQYLDGYVNIDYPPSEHNVMNIVADLHVNIIELDFPNDTVDEIRLHHVFEHFNRVAALAALIKWHTWLKIGGRLHIETPDLIGSAKTLLSDSSWKTKAGVVRHIAGDQSAGWAFHIDHWFPERFEKTLSMLGFINIQIRSGSWPVEPFLSNVTALAVKARHIPLSEQIDAADKLLWDSTVADSELPTYDIWKKQLRDVLQGAYSKAPVNTKLPDLKSELAMQQALSSNASTLLLSEIYNFNQLDRDKWVHSKAASIDKGSRVLDIGAGTCPYRSIFAHCEYKTHDFKKYGGIKLNGTSEYGKIDYESDINDIPVPDNSMDVILCTEVLEHAPEPIEALREMSRILKPGGRLLLTAPLGSGLHQLPYHYYGGFTPEWYKLFGNKFGLDIVEINSNGGFFKLLAQECARVAWTLPQHEKFHGNNVDMIRRMFGELIPRYLFALEDNCLIDQFTVGYHVEAVKRCENGSGQKEKRTEGIDSDSTLSKEVTPKLDQQKNQIVTIIFSKDRALQLDGTLRSFCQHCRDAAYIAIKVLYTTSNALHEKQYQMLKAKYAAAEFIREKDFRYDLLSLTVACEYILFLVDDNIFIKDFSIGDAVGVLKKDCDAIGFSLRLGTNTSYCYMLGKAQTVPSFEVSQNNICRYDWTTAECDFGYPLEVSSSIYRAVDMLPLLRQLDYRNPNTLELALDSNKSAFLKTKKALLCFEQSVTFCNPVNMVQTVWKNRAGEKSRYTPEKLAEIFDEGYRIDIDKFSAFTPNSCHQETNLAFIKPEDTVHQDATQATPYVSIIILNHNGLDHIRLCLESIKKNTTGKLEIIVVDNASSDGSIEYLRSIPDVILIENRTNIGCPPARAQAMAVARGDYVVLLDNDTVVTKGWITKFINCSRSDNQIGIIGPRSNYASGVQSLPGAKYGDVIELESFAEEWSRNNINRIIPSHRLVGFCMFITRAVIDKIGSIDASFGKFGFEDDDYTWRANIAGFKTVIADDIFIHHTGGPQGRGNADYNKALLKAWERFKNKWNLPKDLSYGSIFDMSNILASQFDIQRHFIPLDDHLIIEERRYNSPDAAALTPQVSGLVSIVISGSKHLDDIKKCIQSIRSHTRELHEILFVDTGNAERTLKWLERLVKDNPHYTILKNTDIAGVTGGWNHGIGTSRGEYIILLDHTVEVAEGWLPKMMECLESSYDIGIVGPVIDGDHEHSAGEVSFLRDKFRHRRVDAVSIDGLCMLFRKELYDEIGMFDERISSRKYAAEDYSLRVRLKGRRNLIAGDVSIRHNGTEDSAEEAKEKEAYYGKWSGIDFQSDLGKKLLVVKALEKAGVLHHRGEMEMAVHTLIEGMQYAPEDERLYYNLVEILLEIKSFKDALDVIDRMPANINEAWRLALTGYCKAGMELSDEAEKYADRALDVNKSVALALNLKGIVEFKKGDKVKASEFFKMAAESDPGYGEPHTNLGVIRWSEGKHSEGLDLLEKGFILSPTLADMADAYYSAITQSDAFERAEAVLRLTVTLYPLNKRIAFLLIDCLIRQGKDRAAISEIEQAMITFGIDDGILSAALAVREKLGPKEIDKSKREPTISLCMIVKNEEDQLPKCLLGIDHLVDEMIVVDTGSIDRTRDIAKAYGAKVYDFEWNHDFSEARNASLSKASGDWILVLDADEVISRKDFEALRRLVRKKKCECAYVFTTRNYVDRSNVEGWMKNDGLYDEEGGLGWLPSCKVRLFQNDQSIRFENPVHELVEPSLKKINKKMLDSIIPIHHYGKLNNEKTLTKGEGYYLLGKKKLQERGDDRLSLLELALQAAELKKYDEAVDLWQRLLKIEPNFAKAHFNLGYVYLKLGNFEEGIKSSRKALESAPSLKEATLNLASCELYGGSVESAITALEAMLEKHPGHPSATALLGVAYFAVGKKEKGVACMETIKKVAIDCPGVLHHHAIELERSGRRDLQARLLETAVSAGYVNSDMMLIVEDLKKQQAKTGT